MTTNPAPTGDDQPTPSVVAPRVDVRMGPHDLEDALRADVRRGLQASPKELPPKWFYDDRGCELFDAITRLPEYYPTERERGILRAEADAIVAASGADTLVELGSGTSDKTRVLLDALARAGQLRAVRALRDQRDHPALGRRRHQPRVPRGGRAGGGGRLRTAPR